MGRDTASAGVEEGEEDSLLPVQRDGLGGRIFTVVLRRDEAVERAVLHGLADLLIGGDHVLCYGEVVGCPLVEVGPDAECTLHGGEEAILERGGAVVDPVGRVGHPGHHDAGSVGVGETILNGEAVEGIGVVGGPDLVGEGEDAEVDAAAAAGARFDFNLRMLRAEFAEDAVEVLECT